jgi:hypothetical protein
MVTNTEAIYLDTYRRKVDVDPIENQPAAAQAAATKA